MTFACKNSVPSYLNSELVIPLHRYITFVIPCKPGQTHLTSINTFVIKELFVNTMMETTLKHLVRDFDCYSLKSHNININTEDVISIFLEPCTLTIPNKT